MRARHRARGRGVLRNARRRLRRSRRQASTSGTGRRARPRSPRPNTRSSRQRFGLDREPNFEGQWHLHGFRCRSRHRRAHGAWTEAEVRRLDRQRARETAAVRNRASGPRATRRSSQAGTVSRSRGLRSRHARSSARTSPTTATRAADFLQRHCWHDGRLLAVHKDGARDFPRISTTTHTSARVCSSLRRSSGTSARFAWLLELVETMLARFEDQTPADFSSRPTITSS